MDAVFIETTTTGYLPEQCKGTLTVGAIIDILTQFNENLPVYFSNDRGYSYGKISCEDFACVKY